MSDSIPTNLRKPLLKTAMVCAGAAIVMLSPPAVRDASADERVQLQTFLVRVANNETRRVDRIPITVILSVKNTEHANYTCSLAPRIRDSLLADLRKRQFSRLRNGKMRLTGLDKQLHTKITTALRWDIVRKVQVVEGIPKVSSASAAIFARTGCIQMVDRNKYAKSKSQKKKK